jgi:3-phosphoshikimate 1-carboxyvinyltransferase
MAPTQTVIVQPATRVRGRVRPPGDKSISHRYALLAAIADGVTTIRGYSTGADCGSTLACLQGLGVAVIRESADGDGLKLRIEGRGLRGLQPPQGTLDAGNSGSTMRMLAGLLAAHPFSCTVTGDGSRRRPMRRIIQPLQRWAPSSTPTRAAATDGPWHQPAQAIEFEPEVPSARSRAQCCCRASRRA